MKINSQYMQRFHSIQIDLKPISMYGFMLILSTCILFGISNLGFGQIRGLDPDQIAKKEKIEQVALEFHNKYEAQKAEAERVAREKGWTMYKETKEGVVWELQYIDELGMPQYFITTNKNAARTVNTDDLWTGGTSGLDLDGTDFLLGQWDVGSVYADHQEFNNSTGCRINNMDGIATQPLHSTHVAGTLIAEGEVGLAKGMAHKGLLNAYDWDDDLSEMMAEAGNGLTVSNHSYARIRGWFVDDDEILFWAGAPSISPTEDFRFGFYDSRAQNIDIVTYITPWYLPVWAAGNDRDDDYVGEHYYYNGTDWVISWAPREKDGGEDGYDCIPQEGVAKNILTVGAVEDILIGWTDPTDVVMSEFSSWGPTDDGRIKPDIVANGVDLNSCSTEGVDSYVQASGTSMAAPSTTGTLALLQGYYQELNNGQMSAAALKGLVINTANEAGPDDGPDYMFGWGLLNATGATGLITDDHDSGGLIVEAILEDGQTTEYTYYSDGTEDINVTICWTDPAGTPPAASLNPTDLMLVNDLNLRLIHEGSTNLPWVLNPASPSTAADKGNNIRDNVETVNIQNPAEGYYTIRVYHSDTLTDGQQAYAMIVNGLITPPDQDYCDVSITYWDSFEYIQNVTIDEINNSTGRSPGGYGNYTGLAANFNKGGQQMLQVTPNVLSDLGMVWIDWNQDGDFYDVSEEYILGTGAGPYAVTITAPPDALEGYTTMRIRVIINGLNLACGEAPNGEVEDYSIYVSDIENGLPEIVAMEYFFDVDPGFGLGESVAVTSGVQVDEDFVADMSGLGVGFHTLFVRLKDEYDNWSLAYTNLVYKFPDDVPSATPADLPQTIAMEYFFDVDPGFGLGESVAVTSGVQVEEDFVADMSSLDVGFHTLFVRLKDEYDNWSLAYTNLVYKFPDAVPSATPAVLPQTIAMEYFFDVDPGFGLGESIPVVPGIQLNENFDVDLNVLAPGFHILYTRVKDELDNWSLLNSQKVYIFTSPESIAPQSLPEIVAMEYFIDSDPGYGNGTEILNTPDSLIVEDFFADISTLEPGTHLLYTRVKDEYNRWSISFADYFTITGLQAFLEGAYDSVSGMMSTELNAAGLLPLQQPFGSNPAAMWYYDGNETVPSIPNGDIVDWILLQARDAISAESATSATVKENQVAFLLNNGCIVGLDGESSISFTETINNELYLVIFQRNHLGVLSALPINTIGSNLSYNFSSGPDQIYGGENGHKNLSTGIWGMTSGDGDGNGQISTNDKTAIWNSEAGKASYLSGDYNMDGQVDNMDKNELWLTNDGSDSAIPE